MFLGLAGEKNMVYDLIRRKTGASAGGVQCFLQRYCRHRRNIRLKAGRKV